ncbi:MAG: hypothetical protein K1060chlam4_00420 [Candidatus Anoxychlamydiales bacterium]|nr:hypothetical protein [Candidatus Anoxychlamydiales bacterium]
MSNLSIRPSPLITPSQLSIPQTLTVDNLDKVLEEKGLYEIAMPLIEKGADLNKQDKFGDTALTRVLKQAAGYHRRALNYKKIAKKLNEYQKDITLKECLIKKDDLLEKLSTSKFNTLIDDIEFSVGIDLNESAYDFVNKEALKNEKEKLQYIELAKLLRNHGADIDMKDFKESSPLMRIFDKLSITKNDLDLIELLLDLNADCNVSDNRGLTFLMRLAADSVKYREKSQNDKYQKRILYLIAILLKNGANVNSVDDIGLSALDYAIIAQNEKIAKFLKKKKAISPNPSFTTSLNNAMDELTNNHRDKTALLKDSSISKAVASFPNYSSFIEREAFRKYFNIHDAAFFAKKYSLTVPKITSIKTLNQLLSDSQYEVFYFAAHGKKNKITFTDDFILRKKQIKELDFSKLNPNALFIIDACITGATKGIAEKITKYSKRRVIAPIKESTGGLSEFQYIDDTNQVSVKFVNTDRGELQDITRIIDPSDFNQ